MVNWKKLSKLIPSEVQIASKTFYQVLWVENFPDDHNCVGSMDINKKQIIMKIGQSDKEKVLTYLHEVIHAFSDENKMGLTEKQVSIMEKKMLYFWLKKGNLFLE
jgi:hypothetical protein